MRCVFLSQCDNYFLCPFLGEHTSIGGNIKQIELAQKKTISRRNKSSRSRLNGLFFSSTKAALTSVHTFKNSRAVVTLCTTRSLVLNLTSAVA